MYDCDVLIVGAGPVGLALALELTLHKVSFRIVEKEAIPSDKSRAVVMHPRVLELLSRHCDLEKLLSLGRQITGSQAYVNRSLAVAVSVGDCLPVDTDFPFILNVSQAETEAFLNKALVERGVVVERPVTAETIVQDADGVTTTLTLANGTTQKVRTQYVVGCDGAHSVVRHAATSLNFPGGSYPSTFILCDARLRNSCLPPGRITFHMTNAGIMGVFPVMGDTVRLAASIETLTATLKEHGLDRGTSQKWKEDREVAPPFEDFKAMFDTMTPPGAGELHSPSWRSRFRLHHRCVSAYREGHLLVAGDAAHIHTPAGGQGMNTGIQDAINLAWKLAEVLRLPSKTATSEGVSTAGMTADKILDSYGAERRPVALGVVRGTDRGFWLAMQTAWWQLLLRNFVMRWIAPFMSKSSSRRGEMFARLTQLRVSYRTTSPAVGNGEGWLGTVKGGDRLPNGDLVKPQTGAKARLHKICVGPAHHLILFSGKGEGDRRAELERARETVLQEVKWGLDTHFVSSGDGYGSRADRRIDGEWYVDPQGVIADVFGFIDSGYALVRPDGYLAHVGNLDKLDRLLGFLRGERV